MSWQVITSLREMGLQCALTAYVQCSLIRQTFPELHDKKNIPKNLSTQDRLCSLSTQGTYCHLVWRCLGYEQWETQCYIFVCFCN